MLLATGVVMAATAQAQKHQNVGDVLKAAISTSAMNVT